ncbi:MAG TPA: response regulator [Desulfohalobiaceae bacterium]|nr:response regulator [Desulfohalobiaceae bacterium]
MSDINCLLVDDEDEFLDIMLKRMRKRRLNVQGARSGQEALDILDDSSIDVIALDVKMPGMDGLTTLKEIKRRFPNIEVIMLTGHANIEVAIKGMELGAFDYLMKPMNIDELVFKIQDAYKKKTLQD